MDLLTEPQGKADSCPISARWAVLIGVVFLVCVAFYSCAKRQKYIWYQDEKFRSLLAVFTLAMFVEG